MILNLKVGWPLIRFAAFFWGGGGGISFLYVVCQSKVRIVEERNFANNLNHHSVKDLFFFQFIMISGESGWQASVDWLFPLSFVLPSVPCIQFVWGYIRKKKGYLHIFL